MKKIAIILLMFCFYISIAQEKEPRYTIKNIAKNTALSNFGTKFIVRVKLVNQQQEKSKTYESEGDAKGQKLIMGS